MTDDYHLLLFIENFHCLTLYHTITTFNDLEKDAFCKNNLFFVPNFGQLVKFLSLNFRTRNYDGLEVQQRSAMIN